MGRIPEEDVARVRDATDVVALISESVVLKQKGRLHWGLCPFHGEKTPSFKVDPATQLWHCFGCGEGGDVFGFLMRRENLEFPEAVRVLAERERIDIAEEEAGAPRSYRERLVAACEATAAFYHHELTHSRTPEATAAREYLSARGFSIDVARRFTLGYAPGRGALVRHLRAEGFTAAEIVDANLGYRRDGGAGGGSDGAGGGVTDRFYERVMFPIRDLHGRVIAFGGRVVGAGEPKYLNSSDTPVFHKSANVYSIERAKDAIVAEGVAVVVEGYTDVIALHEAGITNVVATLGTALTRQHMRLLGRFATKVVYLFDGDEAGMRAAARAVEFIDAAVAGGPGKRELDLTVALLPDGLDPADLVAKRGADAMREVIAGAEPLLRFAIEQRLSTHDLATPEGRARALRDTAQVVAPVKHTILGQDYANHLADRLRVDYATARKAIEEARPPARGAEDPEDDAGETAAVAEEHLDAAMRAERALVGIVVHSPHLREGARRLLEGGLFADPIARLLLDTACDASSSATDDEIYRAVAERDPRAANVLSGLLVDAPTSEDVDSIARDLVIRLKDSALERQIREHKVRHKELEATGDSAAADEEFRKVVALQAEREELRRGAMPIEVEVWGFE